MLINGRWQPEVQNQAFRPLESPADFKTVDAQAVPQTDDQNLWEWNPEVNSF